MNQTFPKGLSTFVVFCELYRFVSAYIIYSETRKVRDIIYQLLEIRIFVNVYRSYMYLYFSLKFFNFVCR